MSRELVNLVQDSPRREELLGIEDLHKQRILFTTGFEPPPRRPLVPQALPHRELDAAGAIGPAAPEYVVSAHGEGGDKPSPPHALSQDPRPPHLFRFHNPIIAAAAA